MPADQSILPGNNTSATDSKTRPHIHLKPSKGWISINLRELWQYRELLYFFVWRDIKVRYKQTVLGALWAILQPALTMAVFSLFFGKLAKIPSDGIPYPIFAYAALVPWGFFAHGLVNGSNTLVANANLVKKIYFPRLAMPIATLISGGVDFLLAFLVLLAMMLYFGIAPTANIAWLPCFVLLAFTTSLGAALWLATMNVQFRDIRYTVPFLTQFWLFATPIAYPSSLIPEAWRIYYGLNPMVGVVEGFRWALLGTNMPSVHMILVSAGVSVVMVVSGLFFFRRMEKTFADVI